VVETFSMVSRDVQLYMHDVAEASWKYIEIPYDPFISVKESIVNNSNSFFRI
jgi:hypothetical protein